ncbi:MAG: hypothetical protein AB2531_12350, partial [Candidatus Thiodiazotropha sp.]
MQGDSKTVFILAKQQSRLETESMCVDTKLVAQGGAFFFSRDWTIARAVWYIRNEIHLSSELLT